MRRITLTLTDEEYAVLEQRAAQERRTPREMAAYLVTRPAFTAWADWTWRPNVWVNPSLTTWTSVDSVSLPAADTRLTLVN